MTVKYLMTYDRDEAGLRKSRVLAASRDRGQSAGCGISNGIRPRKGYFVKTPGSSERNMLQKIQLLHQRPYFRA